MKKIHGIEGDAIFCAPQPVTRRWSRSASGRLPRLALLLSSVTLIGLLLLASSVGAEATGHEGEGKRRSENVTTTVAVRQQASPEYLQRVHNEIKAHHYKRAMEMLEVKAQKGCAYSQSLLGLMHQKGLGCAADGKEAAHWFLQAAKNDFADAQFQLGKLYMSAGRDLAPEASQARYWLTRAADQGVKEAKQLIEHIPGGPQAESKLAELKADAAQSATQSEQGLTKSWTGYADIVQTLNNSANNNAGNN
ncbi:MAG: sel1 repeat family protein [Cyanobacteria bacterium REEB67]|nr:sel1 repeat family protein [Cyanobacteria bacterium REEB67]